MPEEENVAEPSNTSTLTAQQHNQTNAERRMPDGFFGWAASSKEESESHLTQQPVDLFGIKLKLLYSRG